MRTGNDKANAANHAINPPGFAEVTREQYFAAVNRSHGCGHIPNRYEHGGRGYIHETRNGEGNHGQPIAISYSGDFPFTPKRYFLPIATLRNS